MSRGGKLAVLSLGFYLRPRLRRILDLCGWQITPGWRAKACQAVGVWGRKPIAARGIKLAARTGLLLLNVEDAFLRSVEPGHTGAAPLGLLTDLRGLHFDSTQPSDLEVLLQDGDLSDPELLRRARRGIEMLRDLRLSKYNAWEAVELPEPGYVLVIDQTYDDAAIRYGGVTDEVFAKMLRAAQSEHPDKRIVIRTHPVVADGAKRGHFGQDDTDARTSLFTAPANPWDLTDRAAAVYCVTSQMGFEAMLAGHRPVIFGQPFYAGWGLSDDRLPLPRRTRRRNLEELFGAAMLIYPHWYDPCRDALTDFETVVQQLAAERRAFDEDRRGAVCLGLKPWKHPLMRDFLQSRGGAPRFEGDASRAVALAKRLERDLIVWASRETPDLAPMAEAAGVQLLRMEDGFLRSVGLGANLLPAASLVLDDLGIYFDPTRPSRLETLIAEKPVLTEGEQARVAALSARLIKDGLTKYNVGDPPATIPAKVGQRRILVPGQVEDDASIRLGTDRIATNRDLLQHARSLFPGDVLIYKPHPDVEAGLREGQVPDAADIADHVATNTDPAELIEACDLVVTMTSLLGFEALLRGKEVHCLGRPFYAGWGLTQDHGQSFARRQARPSLEALIHATLIAYPRYRDPVSGLACPVEVILDRLAAGGPGVSRNPRRRMRWLAALQYRLRRFAHLWR
ncbi:capsular polysaccharide biosynthesis protein [Halovulum sp. GXIMD14793]